MPRGRFLRSASLHARRVIRIVPRAGGRHSSVILENGSRHRAPPPRLVGARPSPPPLRPRHARAARRRARRPRREAPSRGGRLSVFFRGSGLDARLGVQRLPLGRRPRRALSRRRRGASVRRVRRRRARRPPPLARGEFVRGRARGPRRVPRRARGRRAPPLQQHGEGRGGDRRRARVSRVQSRRPVAPRRRWPRDAAARASPHRVRIPLREPPPGRRPGRLRVAPRALRGRTPAGAPRVCRGVFPAPRRDPPPVDPRLRGRRRVRPIGG